MNGTPENSDITNRLRNRFRHGLFATMHTMHEAATEIETLRSLNDALKKDLENQKKRYDFVLHQWMVERFISDQLYADLSAVLSPVNEITDECKTEYMKKYEESRRNGTIHLLHLPE